MTYRRDTPDIRVAVRPSARPDPPPDSLTRRASMPSLLTGTHALIETEVPPFSISGDDDPQPGENRDVILVKTGFRHVATRVAEILYVEAARNYVRIHMESGVVIKSRVQIERLAEHLGERFLRIHRGRLVNVERIRSVRPVASGRLQLTLTQGSTIVVARDRRRTVLAEIAASGTRRV